MLFRSASLTTAPASPAPATPPSTALSGILKSPPPFKRAGVHRNYRLQNFGVMTDKNLLNKIEEDAQQKEQDIVMKETIRNMKKEKAEKKKQETAERQLLKQQKKKVQNISEEPPKKRGRPKLMT